MGLFLLLCLLVSISPLTPAVADPDEVKWSRVNIPTEGRAGNWVLAKGSDVAHLTIAIDIDVDQRLTSTWIEAPELSQSEVEEILASIKPPYKYKYGPFQVTS